MAQVFTTPEGFRDPPDLMDYFKPDGRSLGTEALREAESEWLDDLAEWCRTNTRSNSDLIGEVIHIPWADGSAQYMVFDTKPLSLIHIPLGDAWEVPEYMTRGLRVKDARNMIDRDRNLATLFGGE